MNIKFNRTDLAYNKNKKSKHLYFKDNVEVLENKRNTHIIRFNCLNEELKDVLKNEINYFFNKVNNLKSILIVGLGNDSFTADSVGPKVIKQINVNAHLINLGLNTNSIKVSALEPGVLGQTGIDTTKIIASVTNEIKPDMILVIDSFITNNLKDNEKTIQITNDGIIPGSGIMGINSKINKKSLGSPVIVIGVPTALEITLNKQKLIVSSNSVDKYVADISNLIANAINEVLYFS